MFVSDIALNDYRSYRELVLRIPPGMVVFLGRNGRGKTNLVEAIAYLSTFSSHRANADRALLRRGPEDEEGSAAAVIRSRVELAGFGNSRLLELEIVQGKANRARLNRSAIAPREMLGQLRTVMFAPEDLQLLRGEPAQRRRFLDEIVTQLKPSYAGVRKDFARVQQQRAAVLKQFRRSGHHDQVLVEESLVAWDEALVELSAQIAAHRMSVVESLKPLIEHYYRQISDGDKEVKIEYRSMLVQQESQAPTDDEEARLPEVALVEEGYFSDLSEVLVALKERYLRVLPLVREEELRRSVNLVGAHRDDLDLTLHGLPVKGYASQGETWSVILALRLAQKDLLRTEDGTPVLILDDVFAELDEGRRDALAMAINDVEQVLITAAVASDLPNHLPVSVFKIAWNEREGSTIEVDNVGTKLELKEAE